MRVRVAYGRLTGDALKRASCVRCGGTGQAATGWRLGLPPGDNGPLGTCPRCNGSGNCLMDGFTYSAPTPLARGDIVLVGVQRFGEPYREEEATVLGLGSIYDGDTRQVIRVIEHAKPAATA